MFDISRFCDDHSLRWEPASELWIAVACPECGSTSSKGGEKLYGGVNPQTEIYNCWRCGAKPITWYIRKVTGKDPAPLIWQYQVKGTVKPREHAKTLVLPNHGELTPVHKKYLEKRGFDPQELISRYGIKGTTISQHIGKLQTSDISWRILIPMLTQKAEMVSWQARDITGRSDLRYVGCPDCDSLASYKTLLYGEQFARRDIIGVVEGVFDQWRMGPGFVATLGTGLTPTQLKRLSTYKRVVVCFDSEPIAQAGALAIAGNLGSLGVRVDVVDLELGERDPGDLIPAESAYFRKELGF